MNELQALSLYGSENPFDSALARAHSNYTGLEDGRLHRLLDFKRVLPSARLAHASLRAVLGGADFPCLGAKAALNKGNYRFAAYDDFASQSATAGLSRDLCAFVAERAMMHSEYATFIAFFGCADMDEMAFERVLWEQLQLLHDEDRKYFAYDPAVSGDPTDSTFAFSFAGVAFFVVGMHPRASRLSRRFSVPALAFNAHAQFDALRAKGLYDRFKQQIRKRDLLLQGSLNPTLAEFGETSEARQYSGRGVDPAWRCPFQI